MKFATETEQKVAAKPLKLGLNYGGGGRKQGSWKPIALLHSKFSLLLVKGLYYSPLLGDALNAMEKFPPCENGSQCTGKMFDWLRAFFLLFGYNANIYFAHTHTLVHGWRSVGMGDHEMFTQRCSSVLVWVGSLCFFCFLLSVFHFWTCDADWRFITTLCNGL